MPLGVFFALSRHLTPSTRLSLSPTTSHHLQSRHMLSLSAATLVRMPTLRAHTHACVRTHACQPMAYVQARRTGEPPPLLSPLPSPLAAPPSRSSQPRIRVHTCAHLDLSLVQTHDDNDASSPSHCAALSRPAHLRPRSPPRNRRPRPNPRPNSDVVLCSRAHRGRTRPSRATCPTPRSLTTMPSIATRPQWRPLSARNRSSTRT